MGDLPDMDNTISNKSSRSLEDLIDTTRKSNKAPGRVERKRERMEVTIFFFLSECVEGAIPNGFNVPKRF